MMKENIKKLDDIKELKEDWNGYGAPTISSDIIEKSKEIILQLEIQPDIYPTGRGTVQMQYEKDRNYLEFEIFQDKIICLTILNRDYEKAKIIYLFHTKEINERVNKFFKER